MVTMSLTEPEDRAERLTVFSGSSPEDVSHARVLWSSLALQPPLESRLVRAELRQRLPVSRPPLHRSSGATPGAPGPAPRAAERLEERQRYEDMAERRKEILALLRRQRERRIRAEQLIAGRRPQGCGETPEEAPEETADDRALVRRLQ